MGSGESKEGIPVGSVASTENPQLTLNFQLDVRRNGDYWRIEDCNLVRFIYGIPLFLLKIQKIVTLWFSTRTCVLYTSPFSNPSEEQKKHVEFRTLWSSEPSSRNEATPKPVHKSSPQIDHGTQTEENLEIVNHFDDETNHFPENSTIDKILLCSVCLKQFSSDQYPVTLIPCGHSMCESCWDKDECFNCLVCGQRVKNGVFSKTLLHFVKVFEAQPVQLINEETNNEEEIAENEVLSMENEEIVKPLKEKKFDKAKLCITGLPKDFTVNDVVNGLFKRSYGIAHCDGRPVVSLRVTDDDKLLCIAYFNSKTSARKARLKCGFHLREKSLADATVDFLEITEENEDLICDPVKIDEESALNRELMIENSTGKDETPNDAVDDSVLNQIELHIKPTKDLNKRKLFISGLPREYREYHSRNELFSDVELVTQNDKLQILLMDTGVAQNCVVELKNEIDAKKVITRWNAQIMENGRRLLVEYYGKDYRDFRKNYAVIPRPPQPVELPKAQNEILKAETGSSATTSSKSETSQSSASTSKALTNWTNLAIWPKNMTKSALFISGLPKGSAEKEILETYLNGGKDIMKEDGRYKMITKHAGDGVNCIVYFQKEGAARQIITKWSNKVICGNSRLLVEYFGISKRNFGINYAVRPGAPIQPVELPKAQNGILKTETGSSATTSSKSETSQSSASTSKASTNWTNLAICPKNMTKSALFISGLPKGSAEKEILETYLNGGKDIMKEGERYKMITKHAGDGVNCIVYFQKECAARQIITKWSNKVICGNSRLLVEYFGISKRDFGMNYGVPMIYEKSKKVLSPVNNFDSEENCRIRITRIPFGFTENFIIQTLDQKTIDGVYVYIRMVNGKNLLEFTPATGKSALNGQCIVTLNTSKAAQTIIKKYNGSIFPGRFHRMGVKFWRKAQGKSEKS
ncbi:unnamed protein product, partial [Mesorhabditis belari]|uniref:RING-type domain-containing protein n=1 Tax=Mesorhabditis belari TaxID=2138241 RepID=A0AAF3FJD2_9BILA